MPLFLKVNIMKVKLLTTCLVQDGKRYSKGDALNVSEYTFNAHQTRFEKIANKPTDTQKVITNDEPTKEKSQKKKDKAPAGKATDGSKNK